jgi:hypothetical protein
MDSLCQIEILKEGRDFAARAYLSSGSIKEYRHPVFEEVLTEMVIDLQEILEEKSL